MPLQKSIGSTARCLEDFAVVNELRNPKKDAAMSMSRSSLRKLLGIDLSTERRWFGKLELPNGVNLIKLQIFLETMGYTVTERANSSTLALTLCDYLAFCDVSPKDFATKIGVAQKTVLGWTHTNTPSPEMQTKLNEIFETATASIEAAKTAWQEAICHIALVRAPNSKPVPNVASTAPKPAGTVDFAAEVLADMKALKDKLVRLASGQYTAEDRAKFLASTLSTELETVLLKVNTLALNGK